MSHHRDCLLAANWNLCGPNIQLFTVSDFPLAQTQDTSPGMSEWAIGGSSPISLSGMGSPLHHSSNPVELSFVGVREFGHMPFMWCQFG